MAMDKIILSRLNKMGDTVSRPMTPSEQQEHYKHIVARANQSVTAPSGFADNSLFFRNAVYEAHTFTDKDGIEWHVSLKPE